MTPANHQWPHDPDEALHVPVVGLYADMELGCGLLQPNDDFGRLDPRIRLSILADWMRNLHELRTAAFMDLADHPPIDLMAAPTFSAAMRIAAEHLGQQWPPELAGRLMRSLTPPLRLGPPLPPETE